MRAGDGSEMRLPPGRHRPGGDDQAASDRRGRRPEGDAPRPAGRALRGRARDRVRGPAPLPEGGGPRLPEAEGRPGRGVLLRLPEDRPARGTRGLRDDRPGVRRGRQGRHRLGAVQRLRDELRVPAAGSRRADGEGTPQLRVPDVDLRRADARARAERCRHRAGAALWCRPRDGRADLHPHGRRDRHGRERRRRLAARGSRRPQRLVGDQPVRHRDLHDARRPLHRGARQPQRPNAPGRNEDRDRLPVEPAWTPPTTGCASSPTSPG